MRPSIRHLLLAISALALVGCGAPAPAPTPVPATVARTNGAPGVLVLEALENVVLFDTPGTPAAGAPGANSYLLPGARVEVLAISPDGAWYRVDCWMLDACWVPVHAYAVRLIDATDNAVVDAPVVARLASTAPALVETSASAGAAPLATPAKAGDPARVNLDWDDAVEIRDTVTPLTMDHYVIRGESGDELLVALDGSDTVSFAVVGVADAQVYKALEEGQTSVRIMVAAPQDFMISVATSAPNADYQLYVSARQTAAADQEPRRLAMDDGDGSQIFGHLTGDEQHRFVVRGPADGLLSVAITSPADQASFAVVGMEDGRTYKWLYDALPYWSWRLPSEQDYMILVGTNGEPVPYSISVALH